MAWYCLQLKYQIHSTFKVVIYLQIKIKFVQKSCDMNGQTMKQQDYVTQITNQKRALQPSTKWLCTRKQDQISYSFTNDWHMVHTSPIQDIQQHSIISTTIINLQRAQFVIFDALHPADFRAHAVRLHAFP